MSLFMLDELEMTFSQSEKLIWKRKAKAKHYKRIMEDPELHNAAMRSVKNSTYAVAKQEKIGKKPSKKVVEAQQLKWRTLKQNQKAKKQLELAANLNDSSPSVSALQSEVHSCVFVITHCV